MLVGQSGIGKNYCKDGLSMFDELHTNIIGGATSDSGLFTAFVRNPNLMIVSDEIGDKIGKNDDLAKSFWRLIREVFNTRKLTEEAYAGRRNGIIEEKKEDYNIISPCLSIIGITTPKQLSLGLSDSDVESGTINRFCIVNAFVDEIMDNEHELRPEPTDELKSAILDSGSRLENEKGQKSYASKPELKLIKFSSGDKVRMNRKRRELLISKNSIYTVRSVEKAMRIAMLVTISMKLEIIPTEVLDWALEYELYHAYNIKKISNSINQTKYAEDIEKLVQKLKGSKNGLEKWKVNKYFREVLGLETYKRDSILVDLEEDKLIEWFDQAANKNNGKSKKILFYVGDKRKH